MDTALIAQLFSICNAAVMPFWALLILAPRWSVTERLVHGIYVPVALALVYLFAFITSPPAPPGASFSSLEGVMLFMSTPYGVLAGWVHYLAFDLFIGAWEVRDAIRKNVPHLAVVPCLLLTLMLGPAGLLLYLLVRLTLRSDHAMSLVEVPMADRLSARDAR